MPQPTWGKVYVRGITVARGCCTNAFQTSSGKPLMYSFHCEASSSLHVVSHLHKVSV